MGSLTDLTKAFRTDPLDKKGREDQAAELLFCIFKKDIEKARPLVSAGVSTTMTSFFLQTPATIEGPPTQLVNTSPLFWACMSGEREFVELFLEKDPFANPYARISSSISLMNHLSPFEAAQKAQHQDIVDLINQKKGPPPVSGLRKIFDLILQ
ncbi:MAG: hypothetical protein AUJ12_08960 [Alphaproteobacteria bacterium CG1_02_46_17]|nr:MAG: hypothetical protein AUJ12_08960 [Alphaproteobacteria bacterium CG1_02_46_17]